MSENYRQQYLETQDKIQKIKICLEWWSALTPAWRATIIRSTVLGAVNNLFFYSPTSRDQQWKVENQELLLERMTKFTSDRFISIMNSVFEDPTLIRMNGYFLKGYDDPYGGVLYEGDEFTIWRGQSLFPIAGWLNVKALDIRWSDIDSLNGIEELPLTILRTGENLVSESELQKFASAHPNCKIENELTEHQLLPAWYGGDPRIVYYEKTGQFKETVFGNLKKLEKIISLPKSYDSFELIHEPGAVEDDLTKSFREFLFKNYSNKISLSQGECSLCSKFFPEDIDESRFGGTGIKLSEKFNKWAHWNKEKDSIYHCAECNRLYHHSIRRIKEYNSNGTITSATTIEDVLGRFIDTTKEPNCTKFDLKILL